MGLFVRRKSSEEKPLYSVGLSKTVIIAGLGNTGKKYEATRHNIGFRCVDTFASANDFPGWSVKKDLKCQLTAANLGGTRVILVKPQTMMNLSGEAVSAVVNYYKIALSQLLIVHDELDIDFGQIRTRAGGSAAGNNGVKSIIQHVGEDFSRVRIGIRNGDTAMRDSANFVLEKFSADEQKQLKPLINEVSSLITEYIYSGELAAQTRSFI